MNTAPITSAQRATISMIVDTAIDVTQQGQHKAVAEYRGDAHSVFVTTCDARSWFSVTGESQAAWLARYADESEAEHKQRLDSELAVLLDHLKALLPETQS